MAEESRQAKVLKTIAPTEHEVPAIPPASKRNRLPLIVAASVALGLLLGFAIGGGVGGVIYLTQKTPTPAVAR